MPKKIKKGKIVRREGVNIFDSEKFSKILARRPYRPGVHGPKGMRRRGSDYEQQLRAKQQLKIMYGMRERQFSNLVNKAIASKLNSTEEIIKRLERRLDNTVYRMGIAASRSQARQLVGHGHIKVNGTLVDIPSYLVSNGDVITIRESSQKKKYFADTETKGKAKKQDVPMWLAWDQGKLTGKVTGEPDPTAVASLVNISRVIEFYSR